MSSSPSSSSAEASLAQAVLELGPHIRYIAIARGNQITSRERDGLTESSSSESDFFEELLVNPTLITLTTRRGDLDCGGLRHVIVGYGRFNQVVLPNPGGHVSVAVELEADVDSVARELEAMLAAWHRGNSSAAMSS